MTLWLSRFLLTVLDRLVGFGHGAWMTKRKARRSEDWFRWGGPLQLKMRECIPESELCGFLYWRGSGIVQFSSPHDFCPWGDTVGKFCKDRDLVDASWGKFPGVKEPEGGWRVW
jgi:hypothetical protein